MIDLLAMRTALERRRQRELEPEREPVDPQEGAQRIVDELRALKAVLERHHGSRPTISPS